MKTLKILLAATALMIPASIASAETVTTKTVTTPEVPSAKTLTLNEFDTNKDGKLSVEEIGEELFYIFDTDKNKFLDNIEMRRNTVLTVRPVNVETYTYIDVNNDGLAEMTDYSYDKVTERSGLARFDKDDDGISPEEFVGHSFLELDRNKDKIIDIGEWKDAYIKSRSPLNAKQDIYNR